MLAVVARQVGVLLHMSAGDPGCALYGEDEMRWTAGPRGRPSILGRSIRRTSWLYLPGRVPEREAQHEVQQEFLNECLATTVQVQIFALVTILANITLRPILQSWGKSPNCLAGGIDPAIETRSRPKMLGHPATTRIAIVTSLKSATGCGKQRGCRLLRQQRV